MSTTASMPPVEPLVLEQAQCAGRCALAWTKEGFLLTAGEDAVVAVFKDGKREEDLDDVSGGIEIVTIAADMAATPADAATGLYDETEMAPSKFVVGCNNGTVQLANTAGEKLSLLTRCTLGIRCVSYSPDCATIAVCSEEETVRLVKVDDVEIRYDIKGHDGAVLSVSWSPNGDKLASLGTDGACKIWSTSDWQSGRCPLLRNVPDCVPKGLSSTEDEFVATVPTLLAWDPLGEYLALPGGRDARVVTPNDKWKTDGFLLSGAHTKEISMVAWSPNGAYLASTGKDCRLVVWDVVKKIPLLIRSVDENLMNIAWSPVSNALAVISSIGDFAVIDDVIPDSHPSPIQQSVARATMHAANTSSNTNTAPLPLETDAAPSNAAAETNSAVIAVATVAAVDTTAVNESGMTAAPSVIASESSEAMDGTERAKDDSDGKDEEPAAAVSQSVEQLKASFGLGENAANGQLDDETERQLLKEQLERGAWDGQDSEADGAGKDEEQGNQPQQTRTMIQQVQRKVPDSQEVFQPGATPESNSRRYLTWNQVGLVTSRDEGSHSAIEIDFADKGHHRNLRFTDYLGFTMGALSRTGAVFATPGPERDDDDEDEDETRRRKLLAAADADMLGDDPLDPDGEPTASTRSTIFFRNFDSWAQNGEWTMMLPADERAVTVAAGETFCAVATDRGLLRIFRPSGFQEIPLALKGPIVSMVAGNTTQLLVLYHRSDPFNDGTQAMGYDLWDIKSESAVENLPKLVHNDAMLALPWGVTDAVKWIGFSDASMGAVPMVLTADGLLLGLSPVTNWSWVALLDTRAKNAAGTRISKGQECWPVSVQDGKLMSVLVRIKSKYPFPEVTMPRPTILSYALRIPVLGLDLPDGAVKHSLEEASLQASLTHSHRLYAVKQSSENAAVAFEDSVEKGIDVAVAKAEATIDTLLLKHFVLCLHLERQARALSLVHRLHLDKSLEIALVQAKKRGDTVVASKVEDVIQDREDAKLRDLEEDDDDNDEGFFDDFDDSQDHDVMTAARSNTMISAQKRPRHAEHVVSEDEEDNESVKSYVESQTPKQRVHGSGIKHNSNTNNYNNKRKKESKRAVPLPTRNPFAKRTTGPKSKSAGANVPHKKTKVTVDVDKNENDSNGNGTPRKHSAAATASLTPKLSRESTFSKFARTRPVSSPGDARR